MEVLALFFVDKVPQILATILFQEKANLHLNALKVFTLDVDALTFLR
jgi:hypothetical protein